MYLLFLLLVYDRLCPALPCLFISRSCLIVYVLCTTTATTTPRLIINKQINTAIYIYILLIRNTCIYVRLYEKIYNSYNMSRFSSGFGNIFNHIRTKLFAIVMICRCVATVNLYQYG